MFLRVQLTDELELVLREETEPGITQVYQDTLQSLQSLISDKHQKAAEEILKVKVWHAIIKHAVFDMHSFLSVHVYSIDKLLLYRYLYLFSQLENAQTSRPGTCRW